jgi:hypothetical protein
MRVEAVEQIPKRSAKAEPGVGDAPATLAMKNFLMALESDDSLFDLLEPIGGPAPENAASAQVISGDFVLGFKQEELARQRSVQFMLVEKLIELLKDAGSKETLEAQLCLAMRNDERGNQQHNALCVRLLAKGDSAEQAALRWGLGLAHLQQALLFTSRHLRQHLKQAGES